MPVSTDHQALLQAVVDSSNDAIIGTDLRGVITLWNEAAEKLFGYLRADMLTRSTARIVPLDRQDEEAELAARALRGERVEHRETTRVTRGGDRIDVSLIVSPIRDSSGNLIGLSHIVRDVTQRKSTDRQALHLTALVDSSDDAIASKDLNGIVQSWNRAAERMFGFTAAEIVGRSIRTIIPEDLWPEEDEVLRRVRAGDRVEHFTTIRRRKDGVLVPVSLTVSPISTAEGVIIGASKIARDISERSVLERQASRLAAIVDSSDDAIISKDLDGIVQTWNQAAERMFGFTAEEMIGTSITRIIPGDRLPEEAEVLARIRSGQSIDHYETIRRAKDGTMVPVSLTVSPICDGDGNVVGASKSARDLSALSIYADTLEQTVRDRTAALEKANAQLEAFANSVSHDLRAPLRGMQGLAYALLEDYAADLDERARDYATRIIDESKLLDQLIQDLLAYSRLTHIEVTLERVDVRGAIEAALHNLRRDISEKNATVQIAGDMPVLRANRTLLVQALTNLLSNAFKFGGDRPAVEVRAQEGEGSVRISVEDHGIGIAPQHHERVFRAFERLHGVEAFPGTGMGLAIVQRGIERLGGRVGVESAEGRGSRFWIELPRTEAA